MCMRPFHLKESEQGSDSPATLQSKRTALQFWYYLISREFKIGLISCIMNFALSRTLATVHVKKSNSLN